MKMRDYDLVTSIAHDSPPKEYGDFGPLPVTLITVMKGVRPARLLYCIICGYYLPGQYRLMLVVHTLQYEQGFIVAGGRSITERPHTGDQRLPGRYGRIHGDGTCQFQQPLGAQLLSRFISSFRKPVGVEHKQVRGIELHGSLVVVSARDQPQR